MQDEDCFEDNVEFMCAIVLRIRGKVKNPPTKQNSQCLVNISVSFNWGLMAVNESRRAEESDKRTWETVWKLA